MRIKINITKGAPRKPAGTSKGVNRILEIVKKYHLDLLGSWSQVCGIILFKPYEEEEMHAKGLEFLSHLLVTEWSLGVPEADFTGKILRWVKIAQHYNFSKIPPLDLSLISGALLAIWERVQMSVFSEEYILLGGNPDYDPLFAPARKLWKTVKERNAIALQLNHVKISKEDDGLFLLKIPTEYVFDC